MKKRCDKKLPSLKVVDNRLFTTEECTPSYEELEHFPRLREACYTQTGRLRKKRDKQKN